MKDWAKVLSTLTFEKILSTHQFKHFKNATEVTSQFTDISKEHKHHKALL